MAADGYSLDSASRSMSTLSLLPYPLPNYTLLPELDFAAAKQQLHVVMVPYPVQGQINPMMQLAKLLTAKPDVDIVVTMVHNKHNYDCIQQVHHSTATPTGHGGDASPVTVHAAGSQSKVQFTWVENGLPSDFNYNDVAGSSGVEFHQSTERMKEPLKQLLQSLKRQSRTPASCVVFGTFCRWAQSAAAELGIPTHMFWTQSATMFSIYYHIPLLCANDFFPYNKKSLPECDAGDRNDTTDLVTCIPGLPPLHPSSFPTLLQVDNFDDNEVIALVKEQMSVVGSCEGVIINSFEELEKDAYQALQQELPCSTSLVGPLLPSAFLDGNDASDTSIGASLLPEKSDCIKWLDGKQKHSILYIAFGSLFNPSAVELEGIALGIKSSKQPYLWVIRPNPSVQDVSDALPKGFVEETKDYGLIISWAPQLQVLSHPSVGAFLTHCGWNSTLESLSTGMPMIAFPILVDQTTNSTYVCDFWKTGVALRRQGADGKVINSEDVENAVRTVLHEEEGLKMRERASKLRDAARQAVRGHGSSYGHVEGFIQALRNHATRNAPSNYECICAEK